MRLGWTAWIVGVLAALSLAGCGDEEPAKDAAAAGAGGSADQGGGAGTGAGSGGTSAGSGGSGTSGSGGSGGSGGTLCRPNGPTEAELGASFETVISTDSILSDVVSVAVGASGVYWAEGVGIFRLAAGSTTREPVLPDADAGALELRGSELFYVEAGALKKIDVSNLAAAPVTLQEGLTGYFDFDDDDIVFSDRDAETVLRLPLGPPPGGEAAVLADSAVVQGLDVDADFAYFTEFNAGAVMRVPVGGGTVETLFEDSFAFPLGIVANGANVYWADDGELMLSGVGATTAEPIATAGPDPFLPGVGARFQQLQLVGDRIYFSDDGNSVGWIATDGSACGLVLKDASGPWINSIAVGDTHVYVAVTNELFRVPR